MTYQNYDRFYLPANFYVILCLMHSTEGLPTNPFIVIITLVTHLCYCFMCYRNKLLNENVKFVTQHIIHYVTHCNAVLRESRGERERGDPKGITKASRSMDVEGEFYPSPLAKSKTFSHMDAESKLYRSSAPPPRTSFFFCDMSISWWENVKLRERNFIANAYGRFVVVLTLNKYLFMHKCIYMLSIWC